MTLELRQAANPTQDDRYWTWSVWLEGTDDELDGVSKVRYQLHPTFPQPVHDITDRQSKFRLDGSGWGEFAVGGVGSVGVVVAAPVFDDHAGFQQRVEVPRVEQFVA